MNLERLKADYSKWDSDVFGVKVGTLFVPRGAAPTELIRKANEDFKVVFVKAFGWHDERNGRTAMDFLYDMELCKGNVALAFGDVVQVEDPLPGHIDIAETAFADSRFYRDPLLSAKVPDMYRRWLRNPLGQLWVLDGDQKEDAFLLTTTDADQTSRISLIGVSVKYRGMGLGERLAAGVMAKFQVQPWKVKVATRNWRAVRFYEKIGFQVCDVTTAFHVWI